MNEEKIKTLAELVLVQNSTIKSLVQINVGMIESLPSTQKNISLIHDLEQLSALCVESENSVADARRYFGLPE